MKPARPAPFVSTSVSANSLATKQPPTAAQHPTGLTVAVLAEGDLLDAALCALLERSGIRAVVVSVAPAATNVSALPGPTRSHYPVLVVRSLARLAQLRADPVFAEAVIIGVGIAAGHPDGVDIADGPRAATEIIAFLTGLANGRSPHVIVRLTEREREVLTTYALGATMSETSKAHHVAESTVREHYRRVTQRYEDAGRPVGNKAQLLIRLMADGWVLPREILHAAV